MRGLEQVGWIYDAFMTLSEWGGFMSWRRALVGRARGRVLEIGCGTGRNLALYLHHEILVASDPDLGLILRATRRRASATLVVAAAEHLPFRDQSFDTVVSSLVFCTIADPDAGLREVRRVLADDGRLRMLEHVRSERAWAASLQDLIQPFWTLVSGGCHPNRRTEDTIVANGFVVDPALRLAERGMRLLVAHRDPDPDQPA